MKDKSLLFFAELHRRLHEYKKEHMLTFVVADSMDDFCLSIGYASAVAAYEDLDDDIKTSYVHMSKDKSWPIFYMHAGIVSAPHEALFMDLDYTDRFGQDKIMPRLKIKLDEMTVKHLNNYYNGKKDK